MTMWWLPFLGKIVDLITKKLDPETALEAQKALAAMEAQAREAEARAEAARAEEFAAYTAATQPQAERVYVWANTLIALIRPAMAVFSLAAPFLWPQQWRDFIWMMAQGAPWSVAAISPMIVWVVGRDGLRMFFGLASIMRNGGNIPLEVVPPGLPAASIAKPKPLARKPPDLPPVVGDNR